MDWGADSGYCLMAILVKHAPMGYNFFNKGIGIESHVGADRGVDRGYHLDRFKYLHYEVLCFPSKYVGSIVFALPNPRYNRHD